VFASKIHVSTELPCRVTALNISGIKRTKRAVIEAELAKSLTARNHEELAVELALAHQRLSELDVFKKAECEVDVGSTGKVGDVVVNVEVYAFVNASHGPCPWYTPFLSAEK
jgi:hypothetical protein